MEQEKLDEVTECDRLQWSDAFISAFGILLPQALAGWILGLGHRLPDGATVECWKVVPVLDIPKQL